MAWFPGAIRKEVTRFNSGGDRARLRIKGRGICDHVAASEAASLFNYFNEPGNPCSHFYVRRSGIIEQYVDTDWVAPANLEGNPTLLSIETQGGATESTVDSEPWESAALDSLIQLHIWLQKIDGFPIQEMPNSFSTSKGVGYHRLGIDPWRVSGGELWSRSTGKLCPGLEKIRQIRTVIIPAMKEGITMQFTDPVPGAKPDADGTVATVLEALLRGNTAYPFVIQGGSIDQRLDALEAAVVKLMPPDGALLERIQAIESVLLKIKAALP